MKSPPDQIQVPRKFGQFLDFAGIHGTLLEERTANFIDCGKGIQNGHSRIFLIYSLPKETS